MNFGVRAWMTWGLLGMMSSGVCLAGTSVVSGREPGFWSGPPEHAVVIARVYDEARHVKGAESDRSFEMTIEPLATLAGSFDPSQHAKLKVGFYVGTSSIPDAPAEGDLIMIVLEGGNFIVSDVCQFMPHNLPLVVIDGLSDPRVHDTLKKIRDARAHPLPE